MRRLAAYSFRSPLLMPQLLGDLNTAGPWTWTKRDNDSWGDYISAGVLPKPHLGVDKILREDSLYILTLKLRVESEDKAETQAHFDGVHDIVMKSVLPTIKATDIERTEYRDR